MLFHIKIVNSPASIASVAIYVYNVQCRSVHTTHICYTQYSLLAVLDIDECEEGIDDCDEEKSTCQNEIGTGFRCDCKDGFESLSSKICDSKCTLCHGVTACGS